MNAPNELTIDRSESQLSETLMVAELERLKRENAKLQAFKIYVHERLDGMSVPADPVPEFTASTGCRIGTRLDWLVGIHAGLVAERDDARGANVDLGLQINAVTDDMDDFLLRHTDWKLGERYVDALQRLVDERDALASERGPEAGFWGRFAARNLTRAKNAEARLVPFGVHLVAKQLESAGAEPTVARGIAETLTELIEKLAAEFTRD